MGAGLWWSSGTTPAPIPIPTSEQQPRQEQNLIFNHEIMHSPWWGPETIHEKSLRIHMNKLEREREANRVRWANYKCPQTKPSEWFDTEPIKDVRVFRLRQTVASYDKGYEIKTLSILKPCDGNTIVNSSHPDNDDDDGNNDDDKYKRLEEPRKDNCLTIRSCTCLEPFSSCHEDLHYHHESFHLMPICCGHCDGQKMTCWCTEHNWPPTRLNYVEDLYTQEEDKEHKDRHTYERRHRLIGPLCRPCRRKYKRCEDQPCLHTFAQWTVDPRTREWTWKYG